MHDSGSGVKAVLSEAASQPASQPMTRSSSMGGLITGVCVWFVWEWRGLLLVFAFKLGACSPKSPTPLPSLLSHLTAARETLNRWSVPYFLSRLPSVPLPLSSSPAVAPPPSQTLSAIFAPIFPQPCSGVCRRGVTLCITLPCSLNFPRFASTQQLRLARNHHDSWVGFRLV